MSHRETTLYSHRGTSIRSAALSLGLLLLATGPLAAIDLSEESVESRLHDSLEYLASDDLEGRGPGTEGIDEAAEYIADQFREMGLVTELYDGSPYQNFSFDAGMELGDPAHNRLVLVGPSPAEGEEQPAEPLRLTLELEEDFTPFSLGGSNTFAAELVFAGYGITAPEYNYDDFAELDVAGKVVIILRKEPQQGDDEEVFAGDNASQHAYFQSKIRNAAEHGAAAVILINDESTLRQERSDLWVERQVKLDRIVEAAQELADVAAAAAASPAVVGNEGNLAGQRELLHTLTSELDELDARLAAEPDKLLSFDYAGNSIVDRDMPVFFARREAFKDIVQSALGQSLSEIEQAISKDLQPRSAALAGWRAEGETNLEQQKVELHNVVAVLEGAGPHAEETIVVGAHYDHLGYGGRGSLAPWTHEIHNGADDNGSGTVALLEIARELAAREEPLPRRIVFIAFSGEERGLLGSAHYVREPRFPLESTVAMVNLDMVGRMENNRLTVQGTGTASEFPELLAQVAEGYELEINEIENGYGPSDHASFAARDIPVLFFFTGLHSDYHRPSDDIEHINFEGLRQVSLLARDMVIALSETEAPLEYVQTRTPREANPHSDNPRPYFGSIPDYSQQIDGLPLSGVTSGGPAETAGLEEGDIVIRVGERPISGIEDFDLALREHSAGDKVEVVVRRGEVEHTFTVELGDPR